MRGETTAAASSECPLSIIATFCWGFGRCLLRGGHLPFSARQGTTAFRPKHAFIGAPTDRREGRTPASFWAITGRQRSTPFRSSADRVASALKTARDRHIRERLAVRIPSAPPRSPRVPAGFCPPQNSTTFPRLSWSRIGTREASRYARSRLPRFLVAPA